MTSNGIGRHAGDQMQYRDVVIHTNHATYGKEDVRKQFPPVQERLSLSGDIWVGRLDADVAKVIMDTCEPRVFGIAAPARQFGQLYSFVRELPPTSSIYGWDEDNHLTATVALSRLVHPASTGFRYAARIAFDHEGVKQIYPARIRGISIDAMVSPALERDWLTVREAEVLREIVPRMAIQLPPRIHRALWHYEFAARTYYLDHRWTLVCAGLESLVVTDQEQVTKQFKIRTSGLASEVGARLSKSDADTAYEQRSRMVHGESFLSAPTSAGPTSAQIQLYDRLEDTLRRAVLRAMREETFADIFRGDDGIKCKWPISTSGRAFSRCKRAVAWLRSLVWRVRMVRAESPLAAIRLRNLRNLRTSGPTWPTRSDPAETARSDQRAWG